MTAPDPQALINGLRDITLNLASYVEEQAQLIARSRIAAAESACERRMDKLATAHAASERRSAELVAELRRRIGALEKQQEKARQQTERLRAVADLLDNRDMPMAADAVRLALAGNGSPAFIRGGAR